MHGVVPADNGELGSLQQSAVQWSNRLRQAAAVCHGLTRVHKTLVVGDITERRLFKLVEAQFVVRVIWHTSMHAHAASCDWQGLRTWLLRHACF